MIFTSEIKIDRFKDTFMHAYTFMTIFAKMICLSYMYRKNPKYSDIRKICSSGAVWSGSALFAQAYLSENLGALWYLNF